MTNHREAQPSQLDAEVIVEPYDLAWPIRFDEEAALVAGAIGPYIMGGIHHVGSTAVPGMAAKPIVDIMVGVADLESSMPCIDKLTRLGYLYAPHRSDVMHWFCKPEIAHRTHHLHLVPTGSERFVNVIAFRDYLRVHHSVAMEYEGRKRELADRHRTDREAYTEGKTALYYSCGSRNDVG